jgi:hypothetical protein
MTSITIMGSGNRALPARPDQHRQLRLALAALALPAFFVIGFTLCYTGALQAPAPPGVPVAVAGPAAQTARLRDGLARAAGPAFWHVLNRFRIGASASEAFRGIVYFGGQGAGTGVLKLLAWFAVGAVLLALGWFKLQRGRQQVTPAGTGTAEEPPRSPAHS